MEDILLEETAKQEIKGFVKDKLPSQVRLAFESYKQLLQKSWQTVNDSKDPKTTIAGMSLIKDIVNSQLELVSNVNIIDNVLNTVNINEDTNKNKINPISTITNDDNELIA